jgi:hypothetical protein
MEKLGNIYRKSPYAEKSWQQEEYQRKESAFPTERAETKHEVLRVTFSRN